MATMPNPCGAFVLGLESRRGLSRQPTADSRAPFVDVGFMRRTLSGNPRPPR